MITVNIWYSTAKWRNKQVKHGIFGPLLATPDQNVGHVNLQISVDEQSASFAQIDTNLPELPLEATLSTIPVTVHKGPHKYYEQKKIRSDIVSHSFWPAENNIVRYGKEILHLLHLGKGSKGVPSKLSTHLNDMKREEIGKKPLVIQHPHTEVDLQEEEQALKDLDIEITNLRGCLSNKETLQKRVIQFKMEKNNYLSQQEQFSADHKVALNDIKKNIKKADGELQETIGKIKFLTKKLCYLEKLLSPSSETMIEIEQLRLQMSGLPNKQEQLNQQLANLHAVLGQTKAQYDIHLLAIGTGLKSTEAALNFYESTLAQLEEKINGRDKNTLQKMEQDYAIKKDMLQRTKVYLESLHTTTGRNADRPIDLPTSGSGLPYFVNELAVIEAMAKEKKQNYTFITNNCARSAKRCLLAGVLHLQDPFIAAGVSPKFFKLKDLETCTSLRAWSRDLKDILTQFNFPPQPTSQPKI